MVNSFQLKGSPVKKVDEIDGYGNPICVVTYSSGLTENSTPLHGRCADFSDDEIQAVVDRSNKKPYPMSNKDNLDYAYQNISEASIVDQCYGILIDAKIIECSGALTQGAASTFDEARLTELKSDFGDNWIIEAITYYVFRNFKTYSLEFYAASALYEFFVSKRPFRAGYIAAEMDWKFKHESSAILGQKNKKALQAAEAAKPIKAKAKRQQKLERVAKLWHHLKAKMGANAMRKDTNAAQAIHVEAAKHRYPELLIKETSEVIGPEAIRRLLSELRELDKVG